MWGKLSRTLIAVVAILVVVAGPVGAVTDGEYAGPDDYPYVGLMVAQDGAGNPLWRCSGTLISPTLFLTAGHCTYGAAHVEIWFAHNVEDDRVGFNYPFTGDVSGTPYTHPDYDPNAFFLYDLGMVVLHEPMEIGRYGALPELNSLDQYATRRGQNKLTFTAVGYGLQASFPDAASWKNVSQLYRMISYPRLIQINQGIVGDFSLLLSNNANTGGTCFGDSGGPNFIGDSNIIAGVTSFGVNGNCAGSGGVYRIDREDDLAWIQSFF
jgi:hypothetical protein